MNAGKVVVYGNLRLLVAAGVIGLSACQTIERVDTADIRYANELITKSCVFGGGWEGSLVTRHQMQKANSVTIRSISKGEDGWWRIGYIWSGNYWNFYANKNKRSAFCGEGDFRKRGYHFRKIEATLSDNALRTAFIDGSHSPSSSQNKSQADDTVKANTPESKPQSSAADTRPIAVSWEGYSELLAGTVSFTETKGKGVVNVSLPNGEGSCTGRYQFLNDSSGTATWAVACTNNLAASGTLKGLGKNKGSTGEGTDTKGNKVKFTMGAKS
jgi:hypothetical protein